MNEDRRNVLRRAKYAENPMAQRDRTRRYRDRLNSTGNKFKRKQKGYNLFTKYRVKLSDYEQMCFERGNVCDICHGPPKGSGHGHLVVDHCHITGRLAGLLCGDCNTAIGLLMEDPCIAQRAAEYILERK